MRLYATGCDETDAYDDERQNDKNCMLKNRKHWLLAVVSHLFAFGELAVERGSLECGEAVHM